MRSADPFLSLYALALGAVALLWLGISLFVLLTRTIYDVRLGFVRTVRGLFDRRLEAALADEDAAVLERTLRRLPRRTVQRLAADTATPSPLAEQLAARAVVRDGDALRTAAAAHRNEVAKWRRVAALRILARAGDADALPLLARALEDGDDDVAAAAVTTLGSLVDVRAGELLVGALRAGDTSRSRIATQLDGFPLDLGALLLPLLAEPEPAVRYWAAKLLARHGAGDAVDLELAARSGDDDASVRAAAVESLGGRGGPAARAVATALLEDPVPFVRAHAARALAAQGDPELGALVAGLLADGEWWVRAAAKQALEALGPPATPHVLPQLESPDRFARNGAAEVLQNTGVVDRLVRELSANPDDAEGRRILRLVVDAGGDRFGEAMVARAGGGEERLRELLERAG